MMPIPWHMPPGNAPSPYFQRSRNTLTRWNAWAWSPRLTNPTDWVSSITLYPEGKWQATSVLGSPWPQQGHLPWPSQDAHCGGSCSWVCTLLLLHQVGCPPWILVNHPQPGLQLAYDFQQSFWKIPLPATPLWLGLFPRHLPEKDGSDPWRMPRMYWNHRQHHSPWP